MARHVYVGRDDELGQMQLVIKALQSRLDTVVWRIDAAAEKLDGIAEPLTTAVAPGEEVEVSVRFKAPTNTGEHRSYWRMQNASGSTFGEFFYVSIVVR